MPVRIQQILFGLCLIGFIQTGHTLPESKDPLAFDDRPLAEAIELPDWFKLSFLDLRDSLMEASQSGKRGLIVYFHRHDCAYCDAQIKVNWNSEDIIQYTRKNFDVIAIDVRGQRNVTDFNGRIYTEKEYAVLMKTDFTPSLLIYNTQGKLALHLPGFRPPYQFRAALEYAADKHYQRESFANYLERAEAAMSFGQEELNENDAFISPPYNFDRSSLPGKTPLVIFFEHPRCHACDVLHAGPLSDVEVNTFLRNLDTAQLDTHSDTPVITPDGKKTTARKWAHQLGLSFAPTLLFFDEHGNEIIRVDSVIRLYRLKNILAYVLSKGYQRYPTFQIWQQNIIR
ncbi:MAG: Thioredoxin [Pseudomonadota bacterium]|nr:Thioredoxin [Pseudomonadota bacterium]